VRRKMPKICRRCMRPLAEGREVEEMVVEGSRAVIGHSLVGRHDCLADHTRESIEKKISEGWVFWTVKYRRGTKKPTEAVGQVLWCEAAGRHYVMELVEFNPGSGSLAPFVYCEASPASESQWVGVCEGCLCPEIPIKKTPNPPPWQVAGGRD